VDVQLHEGLRIALKGTRDCLDRSIAVLVSTFAKEYNLPGPLRSVSYLAVSYNRSLTPVQLTLNYIVEMLFDLA
jgi:hypothetical protein